MKEAIDEYRNVLINTPESEDFNGNAEKIFKSEGKQGLLGYIIDLELRKAEPSTRYLAIFHALAGNVEKALDYIEYNVNSLISEYQYLNVEPAFLDLRSEPRFMELLRKVRYME
jgi:hypothetical protein